MLELTGAFDRNPSRRRARASEPQPDGPLGEPPEHLPPSVAGCWREIADLVCAGVLARSDRLILEHAAHLLDRLRSEHWRVSPAVLLRYEATLGQLGLSPTARSRLTVAKRQADESATPFDF